MPSRSENPNYSGNFCLIDRPAITFRILAMVQNWFAYGTFESHFRNGWTNQAIVDKCKARGQNAFGNDPVPELSPYGGFPERDRAGVANAMDQKQVTLSDDELAFMDELAKHEDEWVAILRNGDSERIVGSGQRLKEAKQSALKNGFRDVVFMKVPSSHKIFIGSAL